MYRIRRFGVMKTATVVAIMYMIIVGVFAIPFALLALVAAPSQGSGFGGAGSIVIFALIAIVVYGLIGWVFTAIAVAVYNLAARWVGGIEVEIEIVAPPPPVPTLGRNVPPSSPPPSIPPASPSDPGPPAPTV